MVDRSLDSTLRAIVRQIERLPCSAELAEVTQQLRRLASEVQKLPKWQSLAPTLRKLVDEPEEFDDILQLILTAALSEIRGLEEGSIYQVKVLSKPRALVQIRKLIKGAGRGVGIATEHPRYPEFQEGDGSAASYALVKGEPVYINNCSSDVRYKPYLSGDQLSSLACIPVNYGEVVMAVMCIHSTQRRHNWTDDDKEYLETLARIAANSIGANHSDLTILPNRRQMNYVVKKAIDSHCNSGKGGLWLAFMDLDHFKYVNREFEHAGGDEVIMQFAKILVYEKGSQGQVFHRHGDEFAILWQDLTQGQVIAQAKRIMDAVKNHQFVVGGTPILEKLKKHSIYSITASMGIQEWQRTLDSNGFITRADSLSREAKKDGDRKGRIKCSNVDGHSFLVDI